jgi:hypothetical protein
MSGHHSGAPSPYFPPRSMASASAYFSGPPVDPPEMGEAIPLRDQMPMPSQLSLSNPFSSFGGTQSRSITPLQPPPGFLPSDEQIASDVRSST